MVNYENEMNDVLKALNDANVLENTIIVGSWSMYFYKEIFENFVPQIATTDFDLFLPNPSKIINSNINKLLIDLDYYRSDDFLTGKTRFYSKKGFEIEFLTLPKRNSTDVVKIKNANIGAEALPKMLPIKWNYITIKYHNLNINIPSPASYCLQKLLINKDRKEAKQKRDIDSVKYVLGFVALSTKYKAEFLDLLNRAPKKWAKIINETIKKNNLDFIFDK